MKVQITVEKESFSHKVFSLIGHVEGILENTFGKKNVKREIGTE
ncbi:unnamed protein product [marine sediment metagenome]|uniref:Uncharacterized protein n=1 Tax=marine sediment metagenome TaxID=412755 RepID=X1RL68_9ZZZZ